MLDETSSARAIRIHLLATAAWAIALWPACRFARLELRIGPEHVVWFVVLGAYCFPFAALLSLLDDAPAAIDSLKTDRFRFILAAILCGALVAFIDRPMGPLLAANAFVLIEFLHRNRERRSEKLLAIIVPAAYFLAGFTLVMLWNDVIVSRRYFARFDGLFTAADAALMGGFSIPRFSAWACRFPEILTAAEFIYFLMFNVMGACLVLLALDRGIGRTMKAVGTILLAYSISLVIFMLLTAHGPNVGDARHFEIFPKTLASYDIQQYMIGRATALWDHAGMMAARGDYFIAFPCMHITQPLIAIHFMRHRKRLRVALIAYSWILVPAILALEWHYLVDVIGGVFVAATSLAATGEITGRRLRERSGDISTVV